MTGSERVVRAVAAVLVASVIGLAPSRAAADDAAASAEALFQDAKRLSEAGDYAHACPKLEESQRLDPGMGTLFRLADCYEHVGRTASAWAAFREVAASAKNANQQARAEDAKKRADALEPNLARCEIKVAQPDTPGLVVKRGNVDVGRATWNAPLPVDPGEVVVTASAPGRKPVRLTAQAAPRTVAQIEVPALEVLPPSEAKQNEEGLTPRVRDRTEGEEGRTQRMVALGVGGAGAVGLVVGSIFGIVSIGKKSDADGHCDAANVCDDEGLGLRKDAISAGNVSTVAFVVGGVLVAGGAALWFTAPKRASTVGRLAPRVGLVPRGAGAGLIVEMP